MAEPTSPLRSAWIRGVCQAFILTGVMLASLSLYLAVLKWRGPIATVKTWISWDELIPFRPEWIWAYTVPYLIGPVVIGLLSRETFTWYMYRGLFLVFVSLLVFAVFPTQTIRPPAPHLATGPTADLYRGVIAIDNPPANAAPSLHVSLTCLLAWAVVREFPRYWLPAFASAALVWLSTLLTRQHHLIDVATGVLLATLAALPLHRNQKRPIPVKSEIEKT